MLYSMFISCVPLLSIVVDVGGDDISKLQVMFLNNIRRLPVGKKKR